jgi:hypothetical protein
MNFVYIIFFIMLAIFISVFFPSDRAMDLAVAISMICVVCFILFRHLDNTAPNDFLQSSRDRYSD